MKIQAPHAYIQIHNNTKHTFEVFPEAADEPRKQCLSVSLFLLPSFPASACE